MIDGRGNAKREKRDPRAKNAKAQKTFLTRSREEREEKNKRSKGNTSEIKLLGIAATQYLFSRFSQPRVRLFLPLTSVKKPFRLCKVTIHARVRKRSRHVRQPERLIEFSSSSPSRSSRLRVRPFFSREGTDVLRRVDHTLPDALDKRLRGAKRRRFREDPHDGLGAGGAQVHPRIAIHGLHAVLADQLGVREFAPHSLQNLGHVALASRELGLHHLVVGDLRVEFANAHGFCGECFKD